MRQPTARQMMVLRFIAWQLALNGRPPTYREIAAWLGTSSTNGVHDHLIYLARKGLVELPMGPRGEVLCRATTVTPMGREVLRADALGHTV